MRLFAEFMAQRMEADPLMWYVKGSGLGSGLGSESGVGEGAKAGEGARAAGLDLEGEGRGGAEARGLAGPEQKNHQQQQKQQRECIMDRRVYTKKRSMRIVTCIRPGELESKLSTISDHGNLETYITDCVPDLVGDGDEDEDESKDMIITTEQVDRCKKSRRPQTETRARCSSRRSS